VLFEAIKLALMYKELISSSLRRTCTELIGRFISVREANIRYIGLETMIRLAEHPDGKEILD
jgi:AP-2 complex subunit alpha